MTPYKALATYLQSSTVQSQFDSAFEFYPIQAPQRQSLNNANFSIFTMKEDTPETEFGGGFSNGRMVVEFDFFSNSLATIDSNINTFKTLFVGQSILLDSTIEMAYADTSNEFDAYEDNNKLWIRSLDLSLKYIIK